ncbi:AEC family transporter [Bifidobacterium gallicum]|nr:AEC family transporter [Bifidobacterium gallicum]KFI58311.1 membrane protein [Bifidobacterium gallicum DSM 20093 = LMG 11596]
MGGFLGAMQGFAIIGIIIAAGYVCARLQIGGSQAQYACNRVAFYVANPCLMFSVMSQHRIGEVFDVTILVAFGSAFVAGLAFVIVGKFVLHLKAVDNAVGALCSLYCNANNIGLPVATYILGNPGLVAPLLLIQQALYMPIALAALDTLTSGKTSLTRIVTSPLRQPIFIGTVLGIGCSVLAEQVGHAVVPSVFAETTSLLGGAAVPMILLAFGMSLHGTKPLEQTSKGAVFSIVIAKNILMPAAAFALAYWGLGLRGDVLYGCVVLAALPSAQNAFNFAFQYNASVPLARDGVLMSTALSPLSIAVLAALLS